MFEYPVLANLSHDGKEYGEGEIVIMPENQAAPLIALGVLSERVEAEEEPKRNPGTKAKGRKANEEEVIP